MDYSFQIDVHETRVIPQRRILEAADYTGTRIVDPEINAAKARNGCTCESLDIGWIHDVGRDRNSSRPALPRQFFNERCAVPPARYWRLPKQIGGPHLCQSRSKSGDDDYFARPALAKLWNRATTFHDVDSWRRGAARKERKYCARKGK